MTIVCARVHLIRQWRRTSLGYMEERRWEVGGLAGGFLALGKSLYLT